MQHFSALCSRMVCADLLLLVPDIVTSLEIVSSSVVPEMAVVVMAAPLSSVMLFVEVLPTVNCD